MIVERIRNLDISKRPIITGLYGCTYGQEYFVEDNLCKYNYWQELYRYLRGEGYTTVFYNEGFNFFSYEESQLETFIFTKPEDISNGTRGNGNPQGRYVSQFSSPNGHNRRRGIRLTNGGNNTSGITTENHEGAQTAPQDTTSTDLVARNSAILVNKTDTDQFFQVRSRERVMARISTFMNLNPGHRLAVVFTMPSKISFGREEPAIISDLQARFSQQDHAASSLRIIILYDFKEVTALYESLQQGGAFFLDTWFKNQMFPDHQEGRSDLHKPSSSLYHIGSMGKDEVGNMLKRRRVMDGLRYTLSPIPFDDLCARICQQFIIQDPDTEEEKSIETVAEFMKLPTQEIERTILRMDNEKAINKIKKMLGIDKLIEQFEKYVKAYRRSQKNKKEPKFRPHMAFMGNPGTGKTTVARLFGDMLREEGLLSRGQFIEAKPQDLISQYIGDTRIKAQALCDRAKGGVLFIDEAYGLMSGDNNNGNTNFGKEAIEVLIQFMENNDDSLVILAGYPDDIQRLIKEGNPGFESRFNKDIGYFYFEDYEPDVLYQIAKKNIPEEIKTTEAFDKALRDIIVIKHAYRSHNFGNARDIENLASTIVSAYYETGDNSLLDIKHLPDKLRILVDPTMLDEETMLAELNEKIVGQENIKKVVRELYVSCQAERTKMTNIEGYKPEPQRLNYIFAGNPGTGKTTVARIIGNLLQKMGVLSSNDNSVLTEMSGGEMTQMTPEQIDDLFENNIGKVLFIDEAYELGHNPQVIGEIVQNATNLKYQNKLCLILAGYTTEMHQMMRLNPGMFSRFTEVKFRDYSNKELWEILKRKINAPGSQYLIDEAACKKTAINYFASLPRGHEFGNARIIDDPLLPHLKLELAKRYIGATKEQHNDPDFAKRILPEDFPLTRGGNGDSDLSPMERLNKMQGIENIQEQFEQYREAFKRFLNGNGGDIFRPHMAFMGNPGTGKTTIARLFGSILHEDGLLPQGQFIEATVGDLVGQYIGETRVKAGALCDRAKGGVLFIDEAYGLMSGTNEHGNADFGQEAIEVLIQFMENNDDSLVILAGYPDEIKRLINDGNPGFKSRFNESLGYFYFEDYAPDALYNIARRNILKNVKETTEAFDKALKNIIVLKHAYRTKVFGNARDMENLANTIISSYYNAKATGPLDVVHLPERLRILVDPSVLNEETMLSELNEVIVGQEKVKTIVRNLFYSCLSERTKMAEIKGYQPKLQRLNYIFAGNPGTGKTTIARIIGNLLQKMGVLSSNDESAVTEISGGEVANMTPNQIKKLFEDNIGKVLFIDEAYQLKDNFQALAEIVKNVTDEDYQNKMCIILAGYTKEMHEMMSSNPGMASRFKEVLFQDYTDEQLWEILKRKVNAPDSQLLMDEEACEQKALNYFASLKRGHDFGNARIISETLIPHLKEKQDRRFEKASSDERKNPDFAMRILPEDFPATRIKGKKSMPPMERLEKMQGIEIIKKQFKRYREAFKRYLEGEGVSIFRPHMAFMGNPGTGKTTIARLFGSILHEDGLLSQGQFVEAKVSDLEGQYIGETRIKASALCDRAKGGVLFIDEAYGLMSGTNEHGSVDYGQEAIEVLIQFMENNEDSLVILAGYPTEIKRLINEGNPGFKSRFNDSIGFFYFEDYEPDALYNIARQNIPKSIETTEAFDKALKNIIVLKHAYRTKVFGNARDMENLASTIVSAYYDAGEDGPLDVRHLPDHLRILVDTTMLDENIMLAELNQKIVGQAEIKEIVKNLYIKCAGERRMMANIEGYQPELQRLNYIFAGNPGTGKTTIARIIGNLLQKMGVLSSNDISVITEMSGGEMTQMRPSQIKKLFEENIGKVLFIDEAYELGRNPQVIGEIVKNATNPDYQNKLCIILAGYTKEMNDMMRLNSGMSSRFDEVVFQDYSDEELWEILKRKVNADNQCQMDETACYQIAMDYFASLPRGSHFGNARIIDSLLSHLKHKLKERYIYATEEQAKDPNFARTILPEDFPQGFDKAQHSSNVSTSMINPPKPVTAMRSIDLTKNPADRRVTGKSQLKEKATGLLSSSNGEGTGFIISIPDRYILTCSHVIEDSNDLRFIMSCEREFETIAHVVWSSFEQDMALLQLDEIPDDACYVQIDCNIDQDPDPCAPDEMIKLILCSYPAGSILASTPTFSEGKIDNYEKQVQLPDGRCFDTIISAINATHGCSGGPVVRMSDFALVGILQGGLKEGNDQLITDIHQLLRNKNLDIKF